MATITELCAILSIKHPLDRSTCIGYGKTKPDCGNAVAQASRCAAIEALRRICTASHQGEIDHEFMLSHLNETAKLLHCKRNHQWQAPDKAREWSNRLTELEAERSGGSRHRQQGSHSHERRASPHQRSNDRSPATTSLAVSPSSSTRSLHHGGNEDRMAEIEISLRSTAEILASLQDTLRTLTEAGSTIRHDSRPQASNDDNSSFSSSSPGSLSAANESEDCGICLDEMTLRQAADIWRCRTCSNATHADCFDEWMARARHEDVRCIYCRAVVD